MLANEVKLREKKEQELKEKEESLNSDLEQMCLTFDEKERSIDEMQRALEEERRAKIAVTEELRQARIATDELEEIVRNARKTTDDRERTIVELERVVREKQREKTAMREELSKARTAVSELEEIVKEERLQKISLEERLRGLEHRMEEERNSHLSTGRELRSAISEAGHRLREKNQQITALEEERRQARIAADESKEVLQNDLDQVRKMLNDRDRTIVELQRAVEEEQQSKTAVSEELNEARTALSELEERVTEERQHKSALEESLKNLEQRIDHEVLAESRDWIIPREEVVLSEKSLGRGAWGEVCEGTFRGCQVAVKTVHELIISDYNRRLFEREITIASRSRHPNLLQFIGATNEVGRCPLLVTELLDTSLRHVLSERELNESEKYDLSLDVAKGLNYLHLHKPDPIIHRDISSANVLLWRRDDCWRAKLSDYGSANFLRQSQTNNPGAPIYSAPESFETSQQSPKVKYRNGEITIHNDYNNDNNDKS